MKKNKPLLYDKDIAREFLVQSNMIEDMNMGYAHDDAMKAWKYIVKVPKLSVASILRVHELLMERINPRIAGKFRDCDIYIGGNKKKFFGKVFLEAQLNNWIVDMGKDPIKSHVDFEDIHCFEDGNG